MQMRDVLGPFFTDDQFADLYPADGQPAYAPWRLKAIQPAHIQHFPLQPQALAELLLASKNRSGVLHFLPKSLKSEPPYIGFASALKPLGLLGC